jgi:valyl-tRNA synthetase
MDDKAKFDGATSHDVRDHFSHWVADELQTWLDPERAHNFDPEEVRRNPVPVDSGGNCIFEGARYDFCLFVDDICLESLDHREDNPLVKILDRVWGHLEPEKRGYAMHPDWHDGETDDEFEDVGWMYTRVSDYVHNYRLLSEDPGTIWGEYYTRPPGIFLQDSDEIAGDWRKKVELPPR